MSRKLVFILSAKQSSMVCNHLLTHTCISHLWPNGREKNQLSSLHIITGREFLPAVNYGYLQTSSERDTEYCCLIAKCVETEVWHL